MKSHILAAYPNAGMGWRQKVTKMRNNQVIAIYRSLQEREAKKVRDQEQDKIYHQMDIFEYMLAHDDGVGSHTQIQM